MIRTADFKTGAPLKTYEIRSAKDQLITPPGLEFEKGERIELVKTDDINRAMKGVRFMFTASEIGNTSVAPAIDAHKKMIADKAYALLSQYRPFFKDKGFTEEDIIRMMAQPVEMLLTQNLRLTEALQYLSGWLQNDERILLDMADIMSGRGENCTHKGAIEILLEKSKTALSGK